jgi:hypothetical protein
MSDCIDGCLNRWMDGWDEWIKEKKLQKDTNTGSISLQLVGLWSHPEFKFQLCYLLTM